MHTELFYETYGGNVTECMRNLNDLKTMILISVTKNARMSPTAMKVNKLWKNDKTL